MKLAAKFVLIFISFLWISCHKKLDPGPEIPYLKTITERQFSPDDSVTIQYNYDRDGLLVLEKNSRNFSIIGVRDDKENTKLTEGWIHYRLFTYNKFNQLIKLSQFGSQYGKRAMSVSDTSVYDGDKLVRKESRNYIFNADGTVLFNYPLWITRKFLQYDSKNRIASETDSVFLTHDIPKGNTVVQKIPPRFVYTNRAVNLYSEKDELIRKTTTSNESKNLTYGNGVSAFSCSHPGRLHSGTTEYTYEYNEYAEVIKKTATFRHTASGRIYKSEFDYSYGQ
jgi:hypothetical protein